MLIVQVGSEAVIMAECKTYQSIREAARSTGLPECLLRRLLKENKLPGLYSGRKFNVNVPALLEQLERESKPGVRV